LPVYFAFFIILGFFPFSLAAQNPGSIAIDSFEEVAGTGLVINTNPSGVRVFIDGIERGRTPVTFEHITQGEYQVRLSRDGYKDRYFSVTLFSTSRLIASIKMEEERGIALVSVHRAQGSPESLPFNPQIITSTLDDTSAPIWQNDDTVQLILPAGYRTVRARAFGWEDASVTVLVSADSQTAAQIIMQPALFRFTNASQNRKRFNPLNSKNLGITEIRFEVSAPESGAMTIRNASDEIVYFIKTDFSGSWSQRITWNGRDTSGSLLPEGIYTILIEAPAPEHFRQAPQENDNILFLTFETEINYSKNIFPMSLESGLSGLTFAPMPQTFPAGSFQFEAGFFAGGFHLTEDILFGVPFEINMRIAPFNRLELITSFSINSFFENETHTGFAGWALSGSAKINIINEGLVLFAAGFSYATDGNPAMFPLNPGRGIGVHAPLSFDLTNISLVLSPSLLWRGPEGLVPALLLSTGVLYRGSWLNAGLSMRCEMDFTDNTPYANANPKFLAGAELHLFPPPSNLFFSILGGAWTQEQKIGGYGGFKIGVIQ